MDKALKPKVFHNAPPTKTPLKAPFPWFGGKSRAAPLIWRGLGDVKNYVEPFAGSLAVLLSRPHDPRIETVNDLDCYLANFWRAIQADPEAVARHVDWPVNEADLHARHRWLLAQIGFRERMRADPEFFDAKIAGWWVWGLSQWLGSGWCTADKEPVQQLPSVANAGKGVHRVSEQLPVLSVRGSGVHAIGIPHQKLPSIGNGGRGVHSGWFNGFAELQSRLRRVRVACGDWRRVVSDAVTISPATPCGIVLDPPYADTARRASKLYAEDSLNVAHEVREWAIERGEDPRLRIVLCGYEGEHEMPDTWTVAEWQAIGGYGSQRKSGKNDNNKRERLWFSPHCLPIDPAQRGLFEDLK